MADSTGWRPVVDGELARDVDVAIAAIADGLPSALVEDELRSPSLAGDAAAALFYAYLAARTGRGRDEDRAVDCLERAIEGLAATTVEDGLHAGFAGVAFATEHLTGRVLDASDDDPNEDIDAVLAAQLAASPWRGLCDLTGGLVGIGVYALERLPRPSARAMIDDVVARLDEQARRDDDGCAWFTPPEVLSALVAAPVEHGEYDLGLAHGMAGIAALLAEVVTVRPSELAGALLDGCVRWLLAHRLDGADSSFPAKIEPETAEPPDGARFGWCYGDPGVAVALLRAARATGNRDWEEVALAVARNVARSPSERARVEDPVICHGAAGLAHIMNRLWQATRDELFADAARAWAREALALRRDDGVGVGGFAWLGPGPDRRPAWLTRCGIINGAAGVGLALLALVSDVEPRWDRVLLTSVPPVA